MITYIQIQNLIKGLNPKNRLSDGNGLELRHLKNADKWYVRFRANGKLIQECIGSYPELSLAEARKLSQTVKTQGLNQITNQSCTVAEAVNAWLEKHSQEVLASSMRNIRCRLNLHLLIPFGHRKFDEITPMEVITEWDKIVQSGRLQTVKALCGELRQIVTWCTNTGRVRFQYDLTKITDNWPAAKVKHFPTIDPSQLPMFFKAWFERFTMNFNFYLLMFVFYTLLRQNEVVNIQWSWIDWENRIIIVPAEQMKMKRIHRVPITQQMEDILKILPKLSTYVFPAQILRGARDRPCCKTILLWCFAKIGFRNVLSPHGIRSIGSTWFAQQNVRREVRETCLAHRTGNDVELTYQNYDYIEERRVAMQQWCDFVEQSMKEGLELAGFQVLKAS